METSKTMLGLPAAVVTALLLLPPGALAAQDAGEGVAPWEAVLDSLRTEAGRFATDLKTSRAALLSRAKAARAAALVELLEPDPPASLDHGYAILPEVRTAGPPRPVEPSAQRYSLRETSTAYLADMRDAALLARQGGDPSQPLEALVERYERLESRLSNMNSHISYHAHWQANVARNLGLYGERNRTIAMVMRWRELVARSGDATASDELRDEIDARLGQFRAAEGLTIEERDGRTLVLPVTVVTDIADDAFIEELHAAVTEAYVDSDAARARRFRVALTVRRIEPGELYPEGPPPRGTKIDMSAHLARFPAGALVLTTGARSTHASLGGAIQLGPAAVTRRTLGHEFGHLLGFDDTYLRGYEGDPGDRFGCVLVEWSGLTPDIMGSPRHGRVTTDMIDELLEVYSGRSAGEHADSAVTPAPSTRSSPPSRGE